MNCLILCFLKKRVRARALGFGERKGAEKQENIVFISLITHESLLFFLSFRRLLAAPLLRAS